MEDRGRETLYCGLPGMRSRLKTPFGRRAAAIGVAGVALNRQIIGQYASFGRLGPGISLALGPQSEFSDGF